MTMPWMTPDADGENNAVYPFFWQQGEDHAILHRELEKICESGARGFCVEARPHPDYGGPHWWRDMDMILGFARERGMKVWLLDDDRFPTGHANKAFMDGKHPLANRFLTVHSTDVVGPMADGAMLVKAILPSDGELVGVVACRRKNPDTHELLPETCVDVTACVRHGWLRWQVPEGLWRILVFFTTCQGNGKLDYFNILDSASVRVLIDRVYEPHYAHYHEDFGTTFCGFFSDEPEFANLPWYDFQAKLGKDMPFIPWSGELQTRLQERWGARFLENLPGLWFPMAERTAHIRYDYMDEVTQQLAVSFSGQIGDWCAAHGVMHVGHIIEDDNAHGRLGCSTGHYFRSLSDMKMAGIDVVLFQVMPEMDQCIHQWVASDRDGEFFHYGLGKMGSSLAHIDEKKQGRTMCEIFGAFGWEEGVGLMKWLADHMLSRGVNYFVPHAFSPRPYPDADCPPHFYAHGNHPQFPFFCRLIPYMNRLSQLFRGGRYPANVAVLYHADAEWAGEAMLFQKPVHALMDGLVDCDVVPADLFDPQNPYGMVLDGGIRVAGQRYGALVIPGCQYLPRSVAAFIRRAEGFPVLFAGCRPEGICEDTPEEAALMAAMADVPVVALDKLADTVKALVVPTVQSGKAWQRLRVWPYEKDGCWHVFCFNESTTETVADELHFPMGEGLAAYRCDVMANRVFRLTEDARRIPLLLEPGESTVLVVSAEHGIAAEPYRPWPQGTELLRDGWHIAARDVKSAAVLLPVADCDGSDAFPDVTDWAAAHEFCGTLVYTGTAEVAEEGAYALRLSGLFDCATVYVDGDKAGEMLGAPRCVQVTLHAGENALRIELPLTPVWQSGDLWSALTVLPRLGMTEKPRLGVLPLDPGQGAALTIRLRDTAP